MSEKKYTYKIGEAQYFLSRMIAEQNNPEHFRYNLSAFLAAARTVLQYACKEIRGTSNQPWYDEHIQSSAILGYLRDKRDVDMHVTPLTVSQSVTISKMASVAIAATTGPKIVLQEDNTIEIRSSQPDHAIGHNDKPTQVTHQYFFSDRPNEDLLVLCEQYLEKIKEVVNDGISKGILTDT